MKKTVIFIIFALMISVTLCGCAREEVPMLDSVQSNIGNNVFNQIMETENGFYYNSFQDMSLHFYDKRTGKTIYLCGRPECRHDGSEFCTATSKKYSVMSTAMYGDKIYISALEIKKAETRESDVWKLLAVDFDGSSMSDVGTILQTENGFAATKLVDEEQAMVLHRGKAIVSYAAYDVETFGSENYSYINGYVVVDLATGHIDHKEEYDNVYATGFRAEGDAFYYRVQNKELSDPFYGTVYDIYRYDINEKKSEKLDIYESLTAALGHEPETYRLRSFAVVDNKVYYITGDDKAETVGGFIYDTETGVTREFTELKDIMLDVPGQDYKVLFFFYGQEDITYDGKYLYIGKTQFTQIYAPYRTPHFYVIGTDGTFYGDITYDLGGYNGPYTTCFANGNVYLQTQDKMISASVEELLKGNDDWHEVFTFEDVRYMEF